MARAYQIGAVVAVVGAFGLAAARIFAPVTPQGAPLEPAGDGAVATTQDAPPPDAAADGKRVRRADKRARRAEKLQAEGISREELLERRRQRRDEERAKKEPQLDPGERAEARRMLREERLIEVNERLDAFADERGWEPELTEEVRLIMLDTADRITDALAKVDTDRKEWDEIKADVRDYRLEQAAAVEELLGPEEFEAFVDSLSFDRFGASPPIRGRLPDDP